jgi:hypothetical protein
VAWSQTPDIDWQRTLGGNQNETFRSIKNTSDGGFIVSGSSSSGLSGDKTVLINGGVDYWIIKTTLNGTIEWQKSIGGTLSNDNSDIIQTSDGGYLVGGRSESNISGDKTENTNGSHDYWVLKLDNLGNILWQNTIGGSLTDWLKSMIETPDGGFLLGGFSDSPISGDKTQMSRGQSDYWVVKIDAVGNVVWDKTIGGNWNDILQSVINTDDGGFLLAGYSQSDVSGEKTEPNRSGINSVLSDYWIVKLDANGNLLWEKTIGGDQGEYLANVIATLDSGYVIVGYSTSDVSGEKTEANLTGIGWGDFWIVKINDTGSIIWQNVIGGVGNEIAFSGIQDNYGNILVCGSSNSNISFDKTENSRGGTDFWAVKVNSMGEVLWDKTLGGEQNEQINSASYSTTDNSFIVGGTTLSSNTGDKTEVSRGLSDYWIVKLQPESLSTHNFNSATVQVYPNPSTQTVNFDFNESYPMLKARTFNLLGQLVNEKTVQNTSNLSIDINGESGVYFVEIENENYEKKTFKIVKN